MTDHDRDDLMVQCDQCDQWYHTMCDAILPSLEVNVKQDDFEYICTQCKFILENDSGNVNRTAVFEEKIALLVEEEDVLNIRLIQAKRVADDLKAAYNKRVDEREAMLSVTFDKMKVEQQAYHGNVFVGNHCIKVLSRYTELTDVISNHPKFDDFKIFSQAMKYIMARRFLSNDEIERPTKLCTVFEHGIPCSVFTSDNQRKTEVLDEEDA